MLEWRTLVSPETGQRLAASLEQALAALAGKASVSFREARGPEALAAAPGPVLLLRFTLTRGVTGPACLLLPGAAGLGLARALVGEAAAPAADAPGPAEENALRELANHVASALASAVGALQGRQVGFEAPASAWSPGGGRDAAPGAESVVLALGVGVGPSIAEALLLLPRSALPAAAAQAAPAAAPGAAREPGGPKNGNGIELLLDISLPVTVELGRTRMMIRDILQLAPGSILELDKLAGEPVDIMINDKSIARGEVVVIDENFGVRLTSIVTPSERLMNLR
jgi:flagellar motor switch protein FliN/FliY